MPPIRISLIIAMILADILSRPRILAPFTILHHPRHMSRVVLRGTATNIHHNSNTHHSIPTAVITMLPVAPLRTVRKVITTGIRRILRLMLLLLVPRATIEEIIEVAVFVAHLLPVEAAIAAPASKALPGALRPRHRRHHPLLFEAMGIL